MTGSFCKSKKKLAKQLKNQINGMENGLKKSKNVTENYGNQNDCNQLFDLPELRNVSVRILSTKFELGRKVSRRKFWFSIYF